MTVSITQKIVGFNVVKDQSDPPAKVAIFERQPVISGKTYKIEKSAHNESALYVTINDHDGSPVEMFINSKDMRHYAWTVALTRVVSAVFRKGGDCTFLVDELRSVFDPSGGYFRKGKFIPSLVAEIGEVLEQHLSDIGLFEKDTSLAEAAKAMIAEKQAAKAKLEAAGESAISRGQQCDKCHQFTVVKLDGCNVCLTCSDSKCG